MIEYIDPFKQLSSKYFNGTFGLITTFSVHFLDN